MKLSVQKSQRGFGAVEIIIALVLILGIAGGAYFFINKDKDSGGSAAVNQQVADECNKAMDDKDLCKFAASWTDKRSYVAVMTAGLDGQTMTTTIRNDDKGNTHTTTNMPGMPESETISFDGNTYTKAAGQTAWIKYSASTDDFIQEDEEILPEFDFDDSSVQKYQKEGKEACGNLNCFKYSYTDTDGVVMLWFDDKDYLLRRLSSSAEGSTMEMNFEYTSVTISEPSPVQEFSI